MRLAARIGLGRLVVFVSFVLSLASAGCSSPTGTVSGKVYYKNTLVKGGNVTFLNHDKKVSILSQIQEDGSYKIEKAPVGEVTILVETSSFKPPAMPRGFAPPPGQQAPGGYDFAARAKRYTAIPDGYANPEQSGLKYTVKSGGQEYDVKLQ